MNQTAASFSTDYKTSLPVHVLRTRDRDGESCYFVLRSSALQMNRLKAKQGREQVDVAQYGEILASGYGQFPNARICSQLKSRYGVELSAGGQK